jgi:predicted metalloenzyme YecM
MFYLSLLFIGLGYCFGDESISGYSPPVMSNSGYVMTARHQLECTQPACLVTRPHHVNARVLELKTEFHEPVCNHVDTPSADALSVPKNKKYVQPQWITLNFSNPFKTDVVLTTRSTEVNTVSAWNVASGSLVNRLALPLGGECYSGWGRINR